MTQYPSFIFRLVGADFHNASPVFQKLIIRHTHNSDMMAWDVGLIEVPPRNLFSPGLALNIAGDSTRICYMNEWLHSTWVLLF